MKLQLEKVKELIKKSTEDESQKDLYLGQAIGIIDSMLLSSTQSSEGSFTISDMVWKHVEKPTTDSMMDAVQRHKELHQELSRDAITKQNTQFEQLK